MTRTVDEITLFLLRNAVIDDFRPVTRKEVEDFLEDGQDFQAAALDALLLRLSSASARYLVPLVDFEAFVGEPFSFERHLREVHGQGAIVFHVPAFDFPAGCSLDRITGCVQDYDIKVGYLAFRILGKGPKCSPGREKLDMFNPFLDRHDQIRENAQELGLKVKP